MTDQNPYQASADASLPRQTPAVKQPLRGGMILLLAPVAAYLAFFAGCSALYLLYNAILKLEPTNRTVVARTLLIGPPVAAFVAMLWWAMRTHRRNQQSIERTP